MNDLVQRLRNELSPERYEEIMSKGWDVAIRGLLQEDRAGTGIGDQHRLVAESWMLEGKNELISEAADHIEAQNKTIVEMRTALQQLALNLAAEGAIASRAGQMESLEALSKFALKASKSNSNTPERNDK